MQSVILSAGRGVRMGDLTEKTPKPMLKIKNKPILAYKIEALPLEINEVILIVGYCQEQIREYFKDNYDGRKITYIEQKKLNGTAGAVSLAKDFLKGKFLVTTGDDLYLRADMEKILKYEIAILTKEVAEPDKFGIVIVDQNDKLVDIIEKPKISGPALANIGVYMLNSDFFDYSLVDLGNGEFGLPQTIAQMADKHNIVIEKAMDWFPIGNPDDLKNAQSIITNFVPK